MSLIDARYGSLRTIDTDSIISRSLHRYGEWAQLEIDLLRLFISSGDVVVDAGAFIGTHALAFSAFVGPTGRVFVFEPRQAFTSILRENVSRTNSLNISIEACGLGAREALMRAPNVDLTQAANFGAFGLHPTDGTSLDGEIVRIIPLDLLNLPKVDFIKIDVEGMEMDVLRGAEETLSRCRPVVFAETNSLENGLPVLPWARSRGYISVGVLTPAFNPSNHARNRENLFGNAAETGLLLLPEERMNLFEKIVLERGLPNLRTADDLAALLLHKPQYPWEVLAATSVSQVHGLDFPSPLSSAQQSRIDELTKTLAQRESESEWLSASHALLQKQLHEVERVIEDRNTALAAADAQLSSLSQSLQERNSAITAAHEQALNLSQSLLERDAVIAAADEEARNMSRIVRERERTLMEVERQASALNESIKDMTLVLTKRDELIGILTESVRKREAWLKLRDNALSRLGGLLKARDETISIQDVELLKLKQLLSAGEEARLSLQARVSSLEKALKDRADLAAAQYAATSILNAQLEAVIASNSWRVTKPLRFMAALVRGRTLNGSDAHALGKVTNLEDDARSAAPDNESLHEEPIVAFPADEPATEPDVQTIVREIKDYFDVSYYLRRYPDVTESGIEPIEHYVRHGAEELRDPSPTFSTKFYWDTNPDVKASGINPLLHFVWAGRTEGRLSRPPGGFKARHLEQLRPLEETAQNWITSFTGAQPLQLEDLIRLFESAFAVRTRSVLSFSHDNYTLSVGGVQLCLLIEQEAFKSRQTAYINLHPARPLPILARRDGTDHILLNVVIDGVLVGSAWAGAIASCIARFSDRVTFNLVVHALHGHAPETVARLASAAQVQEGFFWVHDYFSVCQGYNLLRNGISYCGAPPADSAACSVCVFGEGRRDHIARIQELFSTINFTVLAPSIPALEIWERGSGLPRKRVQVLPHCRIEARSPGPAEVPGDRNGVVRVAFAGYLTVHKGWPVFQELVQRFGYSSTYEFHYLGNGAPEMANLKVKHVEVTQEKRGAMIDAIEEARIDFVVLWSISPETFSFAGIETLAGGARILTFRSSGNIARLAHNDDAGFVFDTEEELFSFFQSGDASHEAAKGRRMPQTLEYYGITAAALEP